MVFRTCKGKAFCCYLIEKTLNLWSTSIVSCERLTGGGGGGGSLSEFWRKREQDVCVCVHFFVTVAIYIIIAQ